MELNMNKWIGLAAAITLSNSFSSSAFATVACKDIFQDKLAYSQQFKGQADTSKKQFENLIAQIPDSPIFEKLGLDARGLINQTFKNSVASKTIVQPREAAQYEYNWIETLLAKDPQTATWTKAERQLVIVLIQDYRIPPQKAFSLRVTTAQAQASNVPKVLNEIRESFARYGVLQDSIILIENIADNPVNLKNFPGFSVDGKAFVLTPKIMDEYLSSTIGKLDTSKNMFAYNQEKARNTPRFSEAIIDLVMGK